MTDSDMSELECGNAPAAASVGVTFFQDKRAQTAEYLTIPLDDLAETLANPTEYSSKEAMPLVKLARFGDKRSDHNSLRHDDNVIVVTGCEGDYDGEKVSLNYAATACEQAGIRAVFYTSASHTSEKPRWRILAPFSREHPPGDRRRFVSRLNGVLGGVLASESFPLSQSFYFGQVTGSPYDWAQSYGECIDVLDYLDARAIDGGRNGTSRAERLREIRSGDPVIRRLAELGRVIRERSDGGVDMACPFESEHTTKGGDGDVVYWPANTGGFARGHFRCLHSHCGNRSDGDFVAAIGLTEDRAAHGEPAREDSTASTVARLAALPALEYDRVRQSEAERLGVRVTTLDSEVAKARGVRQQQKDRVAMFPAVEPWPEPVAGGELLDEILIAVQRFIVCDRAVAVATTLWVTLTWLIDSVQVAPLAVITAPEKRCGKTLLLNIIGKLSRRPLVASNISPAATFRVIEACCPTLLLDEADSFLKDNEELRGVINSGHTRQSAYVIRTVGDEHEPRQFSTWGAKAISGIGKLSDTIMDRAIVLELRRKLPTESVQRLRHAPRGLFDRLASMLARFANDAVGIIASARPDIPESLNDRAQDNWEVLIAIADHAGGSWPASARKAALTLSGEEHATVSSAAELLADIRTVFETKSVNKIFVAVLVEELCKDPEKSWSTYNRGKPITPRQLSRRLNDYGISSKQVRIESDTKKGFERGQFADAFARYLIPLPSAPDFTETSKQTPANPASTPFAGVSDEFERIETNETIETPKQNVSIGENCFETEKANETRKPAPALGCFDVSDKTPPSGGCIPHADREVF